MRNFKILSLVLALVMIFTAGCQAAEPAPAAETTKIEQTQEEPATTETEESTAVADAAIAHLANLPANNYMIGTADLMAKMDAGEEMFILDIRQNDVYSEAHLKGAVNVPWGANFMDSVSKLPADKTIYIYCYSGQTANQTLAVLSTLGFDVVSVKYGWNFGISQTEGFEAYSEAEATEFGTETAMDFHPEVLAAANAYFEGLADVADGMFKNYKISEDNANANLENEDFYYLSIRQAADYDNAHIPGAMNIPWNKDMVNAFDTLPMDKTIVVNCYSGQTAGQTVAVLRLLGYDAVSVNGGLGTAGNGSIGYAKHYDTVSLTAELAEAHLANIPANNYMIGAADVFTMIENQEDMFILDVRQADVYAEGHLKGAVNVPWGPDFAEGIVDLPANKPVLVYCYTGQTANQVNASLNILGYDSKSIKYGWVKGISVTEGYEAYTETEANDFGDTQALEVNASVYEAVNNYFKALADTTIKNNIISSEAASQLLDDENYYFLSIRQQADYDEKHVPGAANIPWGVDMVDSFDTLPMDKTIIVNCYSGQTAGQTIAVLRYMGYDAVSLKSGMGTPATAGSGWASEGFETEATK